MKIAVASEKGLISGHFGHCESFIIFETENGKILNRQVVPNPGHKPGTLPVMLGDMGVKAVISGGMGAGAVGFFEELKIQVVVGASGDVDTAVNQFIQGSLKSTDSVCEEHMHHETCGGHQ